MTWGGGIQYVSMPTRSACCMSTKGSDLARSRAHYTLAPLSHATAELHLSMLEGPYQRKQCKS